jgi:hypothetical protein
MAAKSLPPSEGGGRQDGSPGAEHRSDLWRLVQSVTKVGVEAFAPVALKLRPECDYRHGRSAMVGRAARLNWDRRCPDALSLFLKTSPRLLCLGKVLLGAW